MRKILLLLFIFLCSSCDQTRIKDEKYEIEKDYKRGPIHVFLKVDKKTITIADKLHFVMEIHLQETYEWGIPNLGSKLGSAFGIVDYRNYQPQLGEKNTIISKKKYELEPLLSGKYKIPSLTIEFWKKDKKKKVFSLTTKAIEITVKSILPKHYKTLKIHDISDPLDIPSKRKSFLWMGLAIWSILITIISLIFFLRSKIKHEQEQKIPAHEIAFAQLEHLVSEQLLEKGEIKIFYNRISFILRLYIENRFSLRAPEQTTEEFLYDMQEKRVFDNKTNTLLTQFLQHCDLVKFAKHNPTEHEIQKTFDSCKNFIIETKVNGEQI